MKPSRIAVLVGIFAVIGFLGYAFVAKAQSGSLLRIGAPAPEFSVNLFGGGTFNLADQRGKVVVVNFWASWCPPCREEAPIMEKTYQAYKDRGVVLLGVNAQDTEQGARGFIDEFKITFPNGPDTANRVSRAYGLTGFPETSFIDRNGRLVRRWIGPLTERQLSTFIEEAMR